MATSEKGRHCLVYAVMRTMLAMIFALVSVNFTSSSTFAKDNSRFPRSPDELELSMTVDEALEEGPLLCTVNLKNLSKDTLHYYAWNSGSGGWCSIEAGWKERKEPPFRTSVIIGNPGPYLRELRPGQSTSETIYLQKRFLSIAPGQVALRFGWQLYSPAEEQKNRFSLRLDPLFELESKQRIVVKSATAANVAELLRNREAAFAEILRAEEKDDSRTRCVGCAWDRWVETIEGCRHKEFVPLLMRAIDRMPGGYSKQLLIATVNESYSTPEESFAVFAEYLSSTRPAAAEDIFWHWAREESEHRRSKERQQKLSLPRVNNPDAEKEASDSVSVHFVRLEEEAWQSSKRHQDIRLTGEQQAKLRSNKDVWVRALLYAHFPERCPADWVETLFQGLKRQVQPPEGTAELVAKLDHDIFKVREQATQQLIDSHRAFPSLLQELPHDKLSTEAIERIKRIQGNLEKAQLPELWHSTIHLLSWRSDPHIQKMFEILRSGDPRNLITRDAQRRFDERKK